VKAYTLAMTLQVQCYAGRKSDERPVRFQLNDHEYLVEEVVDQWHGPKHQFFKIRADDGKSTSSVTRHRCLMGSGSLGLFGKPHWQDY